MNQTITLGGGGTSAGVLAAATILAYGVWVGRRDLGVRAMWGVLLTVAATTMVPYVVPITALGVFLGAVPGRAPTAVIAALLGIGTTALAFVPLYVAVNWLEVIRRETRARTPLA
ncbi:hypothetical protein HNQ07_003903 [Deinococcus metalli]|uniref:Uncharacterized protein n=1 Tax=Deinococcus metalli TaxID=1141878 RepID=A0A7W8NTP1_9DEIO|nr:hypothetical protein [Deinococcus metalli]MBB5378397.1 hypothetical protein [Deinococcus metalli]GHF59236.1 hypothetical protein GCM10017781_39350 [Deinococcus metalli]